jgi:hypothetical protein
MLHLPTGREIDAWQLAIWSAGDDVLSRPQKLEPMLMMKAGFNAFDPFPVVGDLLHQRDLWRAVLMSRGFPFTNLQRPSMTNLQADLIPLRDLPRGHWNVDTVYLLHEPTHTDALRGLVGSWRADEIDSVTGDEAGSLLGCLGAGGASNLRVWWH